MSGSFLSGLRAGGIAIAVLTPLTAILLGAQAPGRNTAAAQAPVKATALAPARATVLAPPRATVLAPPRATVLAPARSTVLAPARSTVLAIYSSSEDFPGNVAKDKAIREVLLSRPDLPIDYHTEYLESDRFQAEDAALALRDYITRKYQGRHLDMVLAINDGALDFVVRFRQELFASTPVVFWGVHAPDASVREAGGGVTGVAFGRGYESTLKLALQLHPSTERVLVLVQTHYPALEEIAQRELDAIGRHVEVTYVTEKTVSDLIRTVAAAPPRSLIFYALYPRDDPSQGLFPSDAAGMVSQAAPVPTYVNSDAYLGTGALGGAVVDTAATAARVGEMARQVLQGTRPQDIPLLQPARVAIFDWRQLQRWNIPESQLPNRSTVLYRQPGAWELYRREIIAGILLAILQTGFIGALLVQRGRRMRDQQALRDSQQRYTMATGAGAVGVWDWNFDTGEVYVDPILKSILGFTEAEISSSASEWGARVHPDDLAMVTARTQACVDSSEVDYDVEHRMFHKDGSVRWFLSRGSLLRHPDGRPHRMVGTKVDITERKRAEEAIREQEVVLRTSDLEIQDLMGRLITAQEVERARLARDLHDDTSQHLASLAISLSGIKRRVRQLSGDEELIQEVSSVQQRTMALAGSVRQISHDLHPSTLKHVGLVNALSSYCAEVRKLNPVTLTFSSDGNFESIGADAALCLFRIAQEALRNVVAHASAGRADVRLVRIGDSADLTVTDDGRGFDLDRVREERNGLGLVSIKERVRLAGGSVSIATQLGKGTRVQVRIPVNPDPRPADGDVLHAGGHAGEQPA